MNPDYVGEMQETDLYLINPVTKAAVYDPRNRWNFTTKSGTIAHLIHPNNTLSAEVDIAAQATVIRKDSQGNIVTNTDQLIRCSQYGNPQRNSDPVVGTSSGLKEPDAEAVHRSEPESTGRPEVAKMSPSQIQ